MQLQHIQTGGISPDIRPIKESPIAHLQNNNLYICY